MSTTSNGGAQAPRETYGITEIRVTDDNATLLIVVDLTNPTKPSAQGKSEMIASTRGLVPVKHDELPGLWVSVNVGHEAAEYAALKQQLRETRGRIKALTRPAKAEQDAK